MLQLDGRVREGGCEGVCVCGWRGRGQGESNCEACREIGASAVRGMAYVKGSRQLQRTCLHAALGGLMIVCMTYVVLHMLYCILVIRQALHSSRSGFHAPLLSPAM